MKRELRDRWVKALRSGKYKQAIGRLKGPQKKSQHTANRQVDGYCCLGVLLDIDHPEGWYDDSFGRAAHALASKSGHSTKGQYINPSTALRLGLPAGLQKTLGKLNDSGKSFKEIATYIEDTIPLED